MTERGRAVRLVPLVISCVACAAFLIGFRDDPVEATNAV
jgi:hypothetical protein